MATCRIFSQNLFTLWEKSIKYYKVLSNEAWIHILFSVFYFISIIYNYFMGYHRHMVHMPGLIKAAHFVFSI